MTARLAARTSVRTPVGRFSLIILLVAACGPKRAGGGPTDASGGGDDDGNPGSHDDASPGDGRLADAAGDATALPDAFPGVLDVKIDCHNDCTLIAHPPSINVSAGTGFEVNWINVGDTTCDVAKIDQFNQVPIVLGLDPGTSYHDPVHTWCGAIFTGTFQFRI